MNNKTPAFRGEMAWASNFHEGYPISFTTSPSVQKVYPSFIFDGLEYVTSEHLYQSLKTTSIKEKEVIRLALTPKEVKERGQGWSKNILISILYSYI